jgi:2-methylcitrate dehydratase PrpD
MTAQAARSAATNVPITALLAERSAGLRYRDIPEPVRELARQCLLDWFAVTLAGSQEALARILTDEASEQGGKPQATLIGQRFKTSTQQAALVNGAASHALDYDDVNMAMTGHPTVAVLPGLLALAEARGASGTDVIAAFVAGYESICRIGRLVAPGHYASGFHSTATIGSFGSAAACAHLLGLDAKTTASAFGIAGTQAAGLKSMFGTMCKPLHAGKAAQNGLIAATLAAKGFTAPADVLECAHGFAATQSPDFDPEAALADPPGGYHLHNNLFKYHAACYLTHASIECARELRDAHRIDPAEVSEVRLKIDSGANRVCNIPAPKTGLEAKFSLRLTTAFALAGVDTARLDTYDDARTQEAEIVRLRDKVQVELERGMSTTVTEMGIALKDGRKFTTRYDSGIPASDIAAQGIRVEAKYFSLAEPVIGRAQAERLANAVHGLDGLASVGELTRLAVPGSN